MIIRAKAIIASFCEDGCPSPQDADFQQREQNYRKGWQAAIELVELNESRASDITQKYRSWCDLLNVAEYVRTRAKEAVSPSQGKVDFARGFHHCLSNVCEITDWIDDEAEQLDVFGWFANASREFATSQDSELWPPDVKELIFYYKSAMREPSIKRHVKRWERRPLELSAKDFEASPYMHFKEKIRGVVDDKTLQDIAIDAQHGLGFISDVVNYNLSCAPKPQPIFALAGALALAAAILGRRVKDEYETRTNLQILIVGETSSGKDHARKLNDEILAASDNQAIIAPEEVTSDTALFKMLASYPSRLAQFDEFGRFLQTAQNSNTGWLFNVISALLKLYSSADREHFVPKTYADRKSNPDIEIHNPHLVLHATSTPEAIYSGLGTAAEDDGFLGRCLIFESEQQPRKNMRKRGPIPSSIIEFGKYWSQQADIVSQTKGADPLTVATTAIADSVFSRFETKNHDLLTSKVKGSKLWGRAEQKARQLALVLACCRQPRSPVIDQYEAQWACSLVRSITRHMQQLSVRWLASNRLEANHQKLLRTIAAKPEGLTKAELSRKTQWLNKRERNEMLCTLIESGLAVQHEDGRVAAVVTGYPG